MTTIPGNWARVSVRAPSGYSRERKAAYQMLISAGPRCCAVVALATVMLLPAGQLLAAGQLEPRPRSDHLIQDVLQCAGTNEAFWIAAMRENPRNPDAHEAKRKAGWYAAVALWVLQVPSNDVTEAVDAAAQLPRAEAERLARECRSAPDAWRE